jgi:predicted  nucleic acid-binding Zn-ribbon protein
MTVLKQLYRLQLVDSEWTAKKERLTQVEEALGETQDLLQARDVAAETEEVLEGLKKRLRSLEMDVSSVNGKLKANQDRLYSGKVRNPKELSGLHEEAGALRRRRSELEDQELELMIEIEGQEAELAERQARLRQIEAAWREDQDHLHAEKEQLAVELQDLEGEREALRAPIPARDLADYDDLRQRYGGVGLAVLKKGICQVCGVDVPTGVADAVARGEGRHYCPVCNRLLYGG